MGEGSAAMQRGGRAACSGGGGSLMTHKCWLCNHPHDSILVRDGLRTHLIFKTGHGKFAIHEGLLFLKTIIAFKLEWKVCKKLDFSSK
jgi:hypothetical protein